MIKFSTLVKGWIKSNFRKTDYKLGFIFGSSAIRKSNPKDCDLLLVTQIKPGTADWNDLRNSHKSLKSQFQKLFVIKLSIQLYTEAEYNEPSYFKETLLKYPIDRIWS